MNEASSVSCSRPTLAGALGAVLLVLIGSAAGAVPGPAAVLDALRKGGHVVAWRHTEASDGTDLDHEHLESCSRHRNLSGQGRDEARAVGRAIRRLGIPVARVLASPYCRTRETAALAFGPDAVRLEEGLRTVCGRSLTEVRLRTAAIEGLLASPPPDGTNAVLVTHSCNIRAADWSANVRCGIDLAQGDTVVFRPDGRGGYVLVGCVTLQEWLRHDPGP